MNIRSHNNIQSAILFICFVILICNTSAGERFINFNISSDCKKWERGNGDTLYHIIAAPENTYGYRIFVKNKLLIHQLNIPGRPSNKGFKTKTDAEKVAQLVIKKLSKGIMPPTIEEKELIELKIIF